MPPPKSIELCANPTATVLFLLETSISAAFMFVTPEKKIAMDEAILPIADSFCLVPRTHGSACTNRTLRIGGWLTDFVTDIKATGGEGQTITFLL